MDLPPRLGASRGVGAVVRAAVVVGVAVLAVGGRALADDGATDGTRTLSVSQSTDLAADGQSVVVSGVGYDRTKGIYVALCVMTPPGTRPSPCGGGIDRAGMSGASEWISDTPPSYAVGLARAYESGGSFRVSITVGPRINAVIDCRAVKCAILTKNDHTLNDDRSQDVQIPVTFLGQPSPVTSAVPSSTTPTTATNPSATTISPDSPVSSDDARAVPTTGSRDGVDQVTEVTVIDGVDDLAEVARSADGENAFRRVLTWSGLGVIGAGLAMIGWWVARRRS